MRPAEEVARNFAGYLEPPLIRGVRPTPADGGSVERSLDPPLIRGVRPAVSRNLGTPPPVGATQPARAGFFLTPS